MSESLHSSLSHSSPFHNEPPLDFSLSEEREKFHSTLQSVAGEISEGKLRAEIIINGKTSPAENEIQSINPSKFSEYLGTVAMANEQDADAGLQSLISGKKDFHSIGFIERAKMIRQVGAILRKQRLRLAAIMVFEAGKPWGEADADVCEAIDFCDYYANLAESLDSSQHLMPHILGEMNHLTYMPRGIGVAIAPWNFPLAILCGMTVASLVTGNATAIKPAEQTSLIAAELAKALLEAGVPTNAFCFLPGPGESVGRYLVNAQETDIICFTGSKQVGLEILQSVSNISSQTTQGSNAKIKKAILELGGKNAIIVDDDADFDDAIKGVLYSAFGFAGQKCSACSRLIVVKNAYESFIERLSEACQNLFVGEAKLPETFVGPLIDKTSQERVLKKIEKCKKELTLAYSANVSQSGYFVSPTIFKDVPDTHNLWREEVFAPVLAACKADNFTHALELANNSQYALTGGVFSRSPKNLALARDQYQAGNLYINRSITGAIVGRQPFGGYKLSGIGSKAGGPDYLLQFLQARTITENTMRKGFTPELT